MKFGPVTWREPLGRPECPYAERWVLSLGRLGSLRLHRWFSSDDKRAPHDHPSDFITLILRGAYIDVSVSTRTCQMCEGSLRPVIYNTMGRGNLREPCTVCTPFPSFPESQPTGHQIVRESMFPGKIRRRRAEHRHTVVVDPGGCWSLLYFFPERRTWGFWIPLKDNYGNQIGLKLKKSARYFHSRGHHPCD